MKKLLILQINNDTSGGVWSVNKVIAEQFINKGFSVKILSIRNCFLENKTKLDTFILNKDEVWEITHKRDVLIAFKKNPLNGIKTLIKWIKDNYKLNLDYKKMKKFITEFDPNYIISSHYQVLPGIPSNYLKRTIHVHHTAYNMLNEYKDNKKKLFKLKNKITFAWLSKESCNRAIKDGFKNSCYIYNPIRFSSIKKADVIKNKKIITISRFSNQKRIPLMIDIVKDILNEEMFKNWTFEIYGYGNDEQIIKNKIKNIKRINFKGALSESKDALLNSSIYLCTSLFEGFSVSILEAYECGLPVISFDFGEACEEEILNDKTGFIINQNDINEYKNKLKQLMLNENMLENMSKEAKKFAQKFHKDIIIQNWINIFDKIDKGI